jgi:hypothetical protein
MKLGIMQPYFFPYIGYFQLIAAVDVFIVYDNIKYTKKGWINRNRMLINGKDVMFSLPLRKASDSLDIGQRDISSDFDPKVLLNQLEGAYNRAPYFSQTFPLLERILYFQNKNLFSHLHNALVESCQHLGIGTEIRRSSGLAIDHELKAQNKVLAICRALNANTYINTAGGAKLYDEREFNSRGIELRFITPKPFNYSQFGGPFVPWLSIIDVLMFNPVDTARNCIYSNYQLT